MMTSINSRFFGNNSIMKKSKWTKSQIDLLIEKARLGNVRSVAFAEVARKTNRKANSVRNYYYKNLAQEKIKVLPFSAAEVKLALREIVLGTSRGESVRSVCLRLAEGDRAKMLRYQNKYRAVLRISPQRIEGVKNELEGQGYLVKSPLAQKLPHQTNFLDKLPASNVVTLPERKDKKLDDGDINNLFMGLMRLVKKQAEDNVRSQIEGLRAEIERLKTQKKITK